MNTNYQEFKFHIIDIQKGGELQEKTEYMSAETLQMQTECFNEFESESYAMAVTVTISQPN